MALAGLLAALPLTGDASVADHTYVFLGAGEVNSCFKMPCPMGLLGFTCLEHTLKRVHLSFVPRQTRTYAD